MSDAQPPECDTCGKRQWPVIHSCAGVRQPDPRFRDQLAGWLDVIHRGEVRPVWRESSQRLDHSPVADALLPLIAAEVEARVRAAAKQRAVEELEAAARRPWGTDADHRSYLRARAAALNRSKQ